MSVASLPRFVVQNGSFHQQRSEREPRMDGERVSRDGCTGFVVSTFRFQRTEKPRADTLSARRLRKCFFFRCLQLVGGLTLGITIKPDKDWIYTKSAKVTSLG